MRSFWGDNSSDSNMAATYDDVDTSNDESIAKALAEAENYDNSFSYGDASASNSSANSGGFTTTYQHQSQSSSQRSNFSPLINDSFNDVNSSSRRSSTSVGGGNNSCRGSFRRNVFQYPGTRFNLSGSSGCNSNSNISSSSNRRSSASGSSNIPRGRVVSDDEVYNNYSRPPATAPHHQRTSSSTTTNYGGSSSNSNSFGGISSVPLEWLPQGSSSSSSSFLHRHQPSHMCYVPCLLGGSGNSGGGTCVEMMVDTGAESSVISYGLAKQLKLDGNIDRSHQGIAAGVGRARITGKIHNVVATFGEGHVEFYMDFIVLDVPDKLLILGMDQMRKYNCLIDLQNNTILFGGTGGVVVPMLPPDKLPTFDPRMIFGNGDMCTIS